MKAKKKRRLRRQPGARIGLITRVVVMAVLSASATSIMALASETRIFRLQSRAGFLKGSLEGIGVDSLGKLHLADQVERLAQIDEAFLLAAAAHPEGWVVGTGNAGRILLVTAGGEVRTLFAAEEPEIFAVWAATDGTVFAGSSPNGKVYRIAEEEASVFFDPQETYIWSLAEAHDGDLLVATGTQGKLFKVDADGRGSVFFDSEDTHLRAMKVLSDGEVLLGTAGEGLILKLSTAGTPRTLYDAPHPEVVAFAAEPDGACFAALLASEASLVSLSRAGPEEDSGDANGDAEGSETAQGEPQMEVVVTVGDETEAAPVGSRPPGFGGARSEVVMISPEGVVDTVTSFEEETIYSLIWLRDRLWIGTGLEGKIFSVSDLRPVLEKDVDERQVVALLPDSPGPAFATTNAAAVYRIAGRTERTGIYTSSALDAEQISSFGTLRWAGEKPQGTEIEFSVRSGMSSEPDRTWTAWTPPREGEEISLSNLPSGRYVQWRARFGAADGRSPTLSQVTLSYRQANLPPRIGSLTVLDPGQILVPANFNPAQQVYEPASPNREGIFTTITAVQPEQKRRLKTLWRRGFRTLRWEAEDPNGDNLVFGLSFKPLHSSGEWLPIAEDLGDDYYSFDATVLPDGRYRFRLGAFDRDRTDDDERRSAEEISEPVLIDHSVPEVVDVAAANGELRVDVEDRWNPLREAVFSVDANRWRPARAADGLLDGQRETLVLEAPEEGRLVLLRLTDAAFNVVTLDLSREPKP